jgi:subtilisin
MPKQKKKQSTQIHYHFFLAVVLFVATSMVVLGTMAVAQLSQQDATPAKKGIEKKVIVDKPVVETGDSFVRVLVAPFKGNDVAAIKAKYDVRHDFGLQFSANIPEHALNNIKKFADVELVGISEIAAKPVCGDGAIHPREQCGEPGLEQCSASEVCQSCQCVTSGGDGGGDSARACTPTEALPYGIQMVNGGSGGGATVTVLDTGVYESHPDLNVTLCKDATKRGIKGGCKDGNGHGTHVAGTIAGNAGNDGLGIWGVAPAANLWVIKVCGNSGSCFNDDIAAAIRYATDQGTNIISMSLSSDRQSSLIQSAVDYAVQHGVLVIAAAGNDGPGVNTIDYPAANAKVMAIAAINQNQTIATFSSRGINDGDFIIEEREIEVAAPGVSTESTWIDGCYKVLSGTSMATPHVAGLAAKLWQGDALTTRSYLQTIARAVDLDAPGDDGATGFGLPVAP